MAKEDEKAMDLIIALAKDLENSVDNLLSDYKIKREKLIADLEAIYLGIAIQ